MKKIVLFVISVVILLPVSAQYNSIYYNNIIVAPDNTPVSIDDIDQVKFVSDTENEDTTGQNPDVLIMYMKDGTIHRGLCGTNEASIFPFRYDTYEERYRSYTHHKYNYDVEWNVNGVAQTDGNYSVGIVWKDVLKADFKNIRNGICFGITPDLTIEQCDYMQYVSDSLELYRMDGMKDVHYMLVGSKVPDDFYLKQPGSSFFVFLVQTRYYKNNLNWLKIPLEYGKTYYYRTFCQGDMLQHGEMKTVTFYGDEKSFRVPNVMEDSGYSVRYMATDEAYREFCSCFADSITPPAWVKFGNLWEEWMQAEEAKKIDFSSFSTPVEFDNGTAYDLHHVPSEFYTWLTQREIVIDALNGIKEIRKTADSSGDSITLASYELVTTDDEWGIPGNKYVRYMPTTKNVNYAITYSSNEIVPGVRYKLQMNFAPETEYENTDSTSQYFLPTAVRLRALSGINNSYSSDSRTPYFIMNETIPATEITSIEVDYFSNSDMELELIYEGRTTNAQAHRGTHNRIMRVAEIRLTPINEQP